MTEPIAKATEAAIDLAALTVALLLVAYIAHTHYGAPAGPWWAAVVVAAALKLATWALKSRPAVARG